MTTNSFLEYYLTLLAWIVNNSIWNTLVATDIFAVPLAAIMLEEWIQTRGEGADEGNKGLLALARIENRLFNAYVVIIFCCIPTLNILLEQIKFDSSRSSSCGVSVSIRSFSSLNCSLLLPKIVLSRDPFRVI